MGMDNNYQNASMKKVYGKGGGCLTLVLTGLGIVFAVIVLVVS